MLLTDPLDDDSRALLQIVHHGSGSGSGEWPVWQWVAQQAARRGMDAQAVLHGLPQWQYHYRPVRDPTHGGAPTPEDRLGLTVHGLVQVNDAVLLLGPGRATAATHPACTRSCRVSRRPGSATPSPARAAAGPGI